MLQRPNPEEAAKLDSRRGRPRGLAVTGRVITAVGLVLLAGCTSGPAKTASRETSTSAAGKSSTSTAVTPGPSAKLIQPPGPISAHPALLNQASAMCRRAGAPDVTLCAGTIDAEIWGLPLVIVSQLRDTIACLVKVNVLDSATRLDGPDSTAVPYSNDDTLYSTAFLDLRAGPQLLSLPAVSGRYVNFQLFDMYTNTIADVGVLTDGGHRGTYAFVRPGWHGTLPRGDVRIDVPTPDAWLLGRTLVKGSADLLAAVELEAQYSLTPLTGHGLGNDRRTEHARLSGTGAAGIDVTWVPGRSREGHGGRSGCCRRWSGCPGHDCGRPRPGPKAGNPELE